MLTALAFLLLANPAQDPRAGTEPDGNKLVRVELVAERAKLHPGEHFTLAAKLSVSRGWHIYWGENPGDTGVPTRLEIDAPKGFEIGAARFPVPERHNEPGDLVSFIHEGQVLVLFDAVAPAKLAPGEKARFEVSASWLVCTSRCFQGEGEASLELECAAAGEPVPANEALFKEARSKLPLSLSELKGLTTSLRPSAGKPDELHIAIAVADATQMEFLPADQKNPAFVSSTAAPEGGLELLYRWKEPPKGAAQFACPGILSVKTKLGTTQYWFDHKYSVASGN
jgi:DsbC/DsbD-like thiol-disulfide interchange protein